jgi:hypothetical protein
MQIKADRHWQLQQALHWDLAQTITPAIHLSETFIRTVLDQPQVQLHIEQNILQQIQQIRGPVQRQAELTVEYRL